MNLHSTSRKDVLCPFTFYQAKKRCVCARIRQHSRLNKLRDEKPLQCPRHPTDVVFVGMRGEYYIYRTVIKRHNFLQFPKYLLARPRINKHLSAIGSFNKNGVYTISFWKSFLCPHG